MIAVGIAASFGVALALFYIGYVMGRRHEREEWKERVRQRATDPRCVHGVGDRRCLLEQDHEGDHVA